VPECRTETYTCCVRKCIPYQATRCVTVCVPHCETVTECRMVRKCVEKQVACAPACHDACHNHNACHDACHDSCKDTCARPKLGSRIRGLFSKFRGSKGDACCDTGYATGGHTHGTAAPSCCH